MIRRLLFLILAAIGAWWILRRVMSGLATSSGGTGRAPRSDGAMVRDRVCQTFVPRSRALTLEEGNVTHFFCSESCRETFLTGRTVARRLLG